MTSVSTIGSAIGSFIAGPLAKIGKWRALIITNLFLCLGAGITLYRN